MVLLILLLDIASLTGLAVTSCLGLGYELGLLSTRDTHTLLGILSVVGLLFAHAMTMFYFIGTGSLVKDLHGQSLVPDELYNRTRFIKKHLFPWVTLGMVTAGATFVLGGAVDTQRVAPLLHWGMALVSLCVNFIAVKRELAAVGSNVKLLREVKQAVNEGGIPDACSQ